MFALFLVVFLQLCLNIFASNQHLSVRDGPSSPRMIPLWWSSSYKLQSLQVRNSTLSAWSTLIENSPPRKIANNYNFERTNSVCQEYDFQIEAVTLTGERVLESVSVPAAVPILSSNTLTIQLDRFEHDVDTNEIIAYFTWDNVALRYWQLEDLHIETHIHTVSCASGLVPTSHAINSSYGVGVFGSYITEALESGRECMYVFLVEKITTKCGAEVIIDPDDEFSAYTFKLGCHDIPGLKCHHRSRAMPTGLTTCNIQSVKSQSHDLRSTAVVLQWEPPQIVEHLNHTLGVRLYYVRYGFVANASLSYLHQRLVELGVKEVDGDTTETIIEDSQFSTNKIFRAEVCATLGDGDISTIKWFHPGAFTLNITQPCPVGKRRSSRLL